MKTLYYSSFLRGLEEPVRLMLAKEGGLSVERVRPGGVLYRSVRMPSPVFVHQTFLVLAQVRQASKGPDEIIRRLLRAGDWLDRFPYQTMEGKRFRVTVSDGEKKIPANMRFISMLEDTISEHTGLRVNRERPEVELWLVWQPAESLFLWREERRSQKREAGRLRPDVAQTIAFLMGYAQRSVAVLDGDAAVPLALRDRGAQHVSWATQHAPTDVPRGIRVLPCSPAHTPLEEASQDAVCLLCLPQGKNSPAEMADMRSAVFEASRITARQGRVVLAGTLKQLRDVIARSRTLAVENQYRFELSGSTCGIWVARRDEGQAEDDES